MLDYRALERPGGFDKIVMMEVGEHFGAGQFEGYFRKCFELLRPGGLLMIQQITLFGHTGSPAALASETWGFTTRPPA